MRSSPKILSGLVVLAAALALAGTASAQVCPAPPVGVGRVQVTRPTTDLTGGTSFLRLGFLLRGPIGFTIQGWGGGPMARPGVSSSAAVLRERRGLIR